jgi:hypothetical protein
MSMGNETSTMANGNGTSRPLMVGANGRNPEFVAGETGASIHPAWFAFVRFCEKLRHGDIEKLRIQDGLPVLAEVTTKKVKFT